MQPYPMKFQPVYKERIWGGEKLKTALGKNIPVGVKIGESWEIADLAEGKSTVKNGPLAGKTIAEVIEALGAKAIFGTDNYIPPFPLLIKILNAEDVLSVQVHPDKAACKRAGKGEPKTECWYIMAAAEGACIYKGLKTGVTKDVFAKAIEDGTVADTLVKVPVKVGQCHFLPAGTAHAIGAGLLIAEIQTPSDTTYRVFDFNRVDANGNSRQLHIENSLESIHFDQDRSELTVKNQGRLADCEFFRIDKFSLAPNDQKTFDDNKMHVLVFTSGAGAIAAGGQTVDFQIGDSILLPAKAVSTITVTADCEYLDVTIKSLS